MGTLSEVLSFWLSRCDFLKMFTSSTNYVVYTFILTTYPPLSEASTRSIFFLFNPPDLYRLLDAISTTSGWSTLLS